MAFLSRFFSLQNTDLLLTGASLHATASSTSHSSGWGSSGSVRHAWLPSSRSSHTSHIVGSSGFISGTSRSSTDATPATGSGRSASQLIQELGQTVGPLQSTPVTTDGGERGAVEPPPVSAIGERTRPTGKAALFKPYKEAENSNCCLFSCFPLSDLAISVVLAVSVCTVLCSYQRF